VDRNHLANIILTLMIMLTTPLLWSLGEIRLDVYLSMYTLEYLIVKALFNPRRLYRDFPSYILLIIFAIIVGYRVYEVLMK